MASVSSTLKTPEIRENGAEKLKDDSGFHFYVLQNKS